MEEDKPDETARAQSRFYTDFWGLQSLFNNPNLLINSTDNMTKLREGIDKTLAKFASIEEEEQKSRGQRTETTSATTDAPTSESATESATSQSVEKKKHSSNKDKTSPPSTYFPKFLTSPKLLQLEVSLCAINSDNSDSSTRAPLHNETDTKRIYFWLT